MGPVGPVAPRGPIIPGTPWGPVGPVAPWQQQFTGLQLQGPQRAGAEGRPGAWPQEFPIFVPGQNLRFIPFG